MVSVQKAKTLINATFVEEALIIGGMAAVMEVSDAFLWRLMENLNDLRKRTLEKVEKELATAAPTASDVRPHPAVQQFLTTVREESRLREVRG